LTVEEGAMNRSRRSLLALAAFLALPGAAASAQDGMTAVYAFTWAGLDVGRFEVELEASGSGYRAGWVAGTAGMVGTLFPFVSEGTAAGRREGDRFLPTHFDGRSEWRDGGSQWRVAFAPDGRAVDVEVPAEDLADREPVPEALQVGPDPASLALAAISRAAPGVRLDGQSFDGRRAVHLELACAEGNAAPELACTISSRLIAGASRGWRERTRGEPPREPVRVWLRTGVHGDGFWPVRLEAPSRFGTVEARLISIDRLPAAG
jgi:hypothetical protein